MEPMTTTDLSHLAEDLVSDGFVGHEAAVRQVVRSARMAGLSAVLIGVLADPREPEVARLRAFGRLAGSLAVGRVHLPLAAVA
jgi:hypothetical protein